MAGDVVSAGTFVASVLEQAGYLTQSEFLVAFKSFFRDAGALVYFIGAVGGLISFVVFGSFRASRYLIFGPAIYWALVGPTVDVGGVVAKLGGGVPGGFIGDKGEAQAAADRDAVLDKSGRSVAKQIKLAEGFWLFAHPINDFVNEFVDVMLKDEDGENLMVEHKVRGLELIARSLPTSPEEINILEQELLVYCPTLYQFALGVAQNYVKSRSVEGISKSSIPAAAKYKEVADSKFNEFLRAGDASTIAINSTNTPMLFKHISEKKGEDKTYAAYGGGGPLPVISCALAWDIFLEIIWHKAAGHMPNILALTAGFWDGDGSKQRACEFLTSKLYDDAPVPRGGGAECDIHSGVALALLGNHLAYMDTFQRVLKRHVNTQDPLNPKEHSSILASTTLMANKVNNFIQVAVSQTSLGAPVGMISNVAKNVIDYAPAVVMNLIQGVTHTEQVGLPIYVMTQARKEIYARAMHMPYYQGICLYLIAVAYPFMALLVLLPGKASVFLNVPLAWLWIKSWDIGFAAVILLERVMYNLLPNASIAPALRTGPWNWEKLPIVLGEAFNFNHVQNIAQYYTILGMATAAIPVLTGVIILKAKKAILGSLVGAIDNTSRDSGMREAGSYSIASSNERAELRSRIEGFARQQVILGSGGVEGGLRGFTGSAGGMLKMMVNSPSYMASAIKDKKFNLADLAKESPKQFMDQYQQGVTSGVNFESEHRAAFDPMFGRWGIMQMNADAYAAALDGAGTRLSGGFETNAAKANAIDQQMKMIGSSIGNILDLEMDRSKGIGGLVGTAIAGDENAIKLLLAGGYAKEFAEQALEQKFGNSNNDLNYFKTTFDFLSSEDNGFEKGLAYQRFFGFSAETILKSYEALNDPQGTEEEKAQAKAKLDELLNMGGVVGDYHRFRFSEAVRSELGMIPGGASEQHFYGFGGDRTVHEITPNGLGKSIGSNEFNDGGFFSELQSKTKKWSILENLGIPMDQDKIFMDERLSIDTVLKQQNNTQYVDNFKGIAEFLQKSSELEGKYTVGNLSGSDQAVIDQAMVTEVQKLLEIIDRDYKVHSRGFKLPDNIGEISQTNPLLGAQIIENYFENFSQAKKAENADREFRERAGNASQSIFSTAGQARRGP